VASSLNLSLWKSVVKIGREFHQIKSNKPRLLPGDLLALVVQPKHLGVIGRLARQVHVRADLLEQRVDVLVDLHLVAAGERLDHVVGVEVRLLVGALVEVHGRRCLYYPAAAARHAREGALRAALWNVVRMHNQLGHDLAETCRTSLHDCVGFEVVVLMVGRGKKMNFFDKKNCQGLFYIFF
jgi:hypothetical protein